MEYRLFLENTEVYLKSFEIHMGVWGIIKNIEGLSGAAARTGDLRKNKYNNY